jgi:hypothetical protein
MLLFMYHFGILGIRDSCTDCVCNYFVLCCVVLSDKVT